MSPTIVPVHGGFVDGSDRVTSHRQVGASAGPRVAAQSICRGGVRLAGVVQDGPGRSVWDGESRRLSAPGVLGRPAAGDRPTGDENGGF
jgi:hypothetical protein